MLFGTKRGFFEFIFDFLKFLKTELALGTPKETTLFSDEKWLRPPSCLFGLLHTHIHTQNCHLQWPLVLWTGGQKNGRSCFHYFHVFNNPLKTFQYLHTIKHPPTLPPSLLPPRVLTPALQSCISACFILPLNSEENRRYCSAEP